MRQKDAIAFCNIYAKGFLKSDENNDKDNNMDKCGI